MKIAVLVKQVPDTWAERRMDVSTGYVDRSASPPVIDEICEHAMEVGLRIREQHGGTVVAISMGPEKASDALRRCLEMGADEAILISDDRLVGADLAVTSDVLARVLAGTADVIVAGTASTDGRAGLLPAMIAESLDLPLLSGLDEVHVADGSVRGRRVIPGGTQELRAELPAVLTATERAAEPRVPGLRDVLRARKRKPVRRSLDDIAEATIEPRSRVLTVAERPPRVAGPRVNFSQDAVRDVVDMLVTRRLVETEKP